MDDRRPSYEELEARLAEAESILRAISSDRIDALVGQRGVYLLHLHEMEKALEESRARYRSLFDHMSEGFFLAEIICNQAGEPVDYRHLAVNPALEAVVGMKPEALVGRTRGEVLPDPSPWMDIFGRVALTGRAETFEGYSAGLDRHFAVSVYSPKQGQFACLVRDVTAQMQTTEALRRSEQELRAMFDVVSVGIVQVDPSDGRFLRCNEKFCEITGYSQQELAGLTFSELTHHDDRRDDWALFTRALANHAPGYLNEKRYIRKDGSIIWVRVNASFIRDEAGRAVRSAAICEDITDRKHSEGALGKKNELLESIVGHIPVLLVMWDPHLERFTLNRYAEEVLGYSCDEANEGDFMERIYPDEAYRKDVSAFMKSLEPGWREWVMTTKDNEKVPIDWANIALSDNSRIGIGVDLRERKNAETALRESHKELNEYTYALTHNIKAPFRAVQNYANFLLEDLAGTLEGEPKQFLEGIRKAVTLAQQQFVDLETLYQVKDHPLEFEFIDMHELLAELAALHDTAHGRELVIEARWPTFRGERFLLRQILMALISNGFKYNRSPRKRVHVGWHRGVDNRLEIVVRDNGIGIDPQYHEHVFHIFKRLHTEEEYEGTGIGLAIVRRAVKKIGGDVRIESAAGQGATFVVSLPPARSERGETIGTLN